MAKAAPGTVEPEAGCDQSSVDGFSSKASDISCLGITTNHHNTLRLTNHKC